MGRLTHTPAFAIAAERCRRAGQHERAVALCEEGLAEFPRFVSARVTLGCSLIAMGQLTRGRTELETVLRGAPDNLAAIRALAELHDRTAGEMSDESQVQAPAAASAAPPPDRSSAPPAERSPAPPADRHAAAPAELTFTSLRTEQAARPAVESLESLESLDGAADAFAWEPVVELDTEDAPELPMFEFGFMPPRRLGFGEAVSQGLGRGQAEAVEALERFLARIETRRARRAVA